MRFERHFLQNGIDYPRPAAKLRLFKFGLIKLNSSVAQMKPGQTAVISGFTDSELSVKLLEMGFLPGMAVRYNFKAPLGDPICVSVSGLDLSLRLDEAATITILG
jgi:ferrous iron transport protein A